MLWKHCLKCVAWCFGFLKNLMCFQLFNIRNLIPASLSGNSTRDFAISQCADSADAHSRVGIPWVQPKVKNEEAVLQRKWLQKKKYACPYLQSTPQSQDNLYSKTACLFNQIILSLEKQHFKPIHIQFTRLSVCISGKITVILCWIEKEMKALRQASNNPPESFSEFYPIFRPTMVVCTAVFKNG